MERQIVLHTQNGYHTLEAYLKTTGAAHIFLICGSSIHRLTLDAFFQSLPQRMGIRVTRFMDFLPNPTYHSAAEAVRRFQQANCDMIIAVGGGSAIDVAKYVKLYAGSDENCLEQEPVPNAVRLLAVPTTAGSGSEATRFAVLYRDGRKLSVMHDSCLPDAVLFDSSVLKTLPDYQRKSTMLDALCHAVESFWCIHATEQSREASRKALRLILENQEAYLNNQEIGNTAMQQAAYIAGKAINLTQTTAGHAMAYGMTSLYGIAHGHAAALCVSVLWPYMAAHSEQCTAFGGGAGFRAVLQELAHAMGCANTVCAVRRYTALLESLQLKTPVGSAADLDLLSAGINQERLKNNPISLDGQAVRVLYRQILFHEENKGRDSV